MNITKQWDMVSEATGLGKLSDMLGPNVSKEFRNAVDNPVTFKTIKEAEDYYMSKYAKTNNAHDEETASMERWIEQQNIGELPTNNK